MWPHQLAANAHLCVAAGGRGDCHRAWVELQSGHPGRVSGPEPQHQGALAAHHRRAGRRHCRCVLDLGVAAVIQTGVGPLWVWGPLWGVWGPLWGVGATGGVCGATVGVCGAAVGVCGGHCGACGPLWGCGAAVGLCGTVVGTVCGSAANTPNGHKYMFFLAFRRFLAPAHHVGRTSKGHINAMLMR